MTKVSYLITTSNGGAIKSESYPKAVEVCDNLRAMGSIVSMQTIYEPVVTQKCVMSEKRREALRKKFGRNK